MTLIQKLRAIAEYMGGVRVLHPEQKHFSQNFYGYVCHKGQWWNETNLHYNTSWDWLMPVIEKISKTPLLEADGTPCQNRTDVCYPITFGMPAPEEDLVMFRFVGGDLHYGKTWIEAAFEAVYDFVELENLKNKPVK